MDAFSKKFPNAKITEESPGDDTDEPSMMIRTSGNYSFEPLVIKDSQKAFRSIDPSGGFGGHGNPDEDDYSQMWAAKDNDDHENAASATANSYMMGGDTSQNHDDVNQAHIDGNYSGNQDAI